MNFKINPAESVRIKTQLFGQHFSFADSSPELLFHANFMLWLQSLVKLTQIISPSCYNLSFAIPKYVHLKQTRKVLEKVKVPDCKGNTGPWIILCQVSEIDLSFTRHFSKRYNVVYVQISWFLKSRFCNCLIY